MGTFEEDFALLRERRAAPMALGAVVAGVPFEDVLTGYGVAVAAETALRAGPAAAGMAGRLPSRDSARWAAAWLVLGHARDRAVVAQFRAEQSGRTRVRIDMP